MTLPGFERTEPRHPAKASVGYLAYLAAIDYGDGWRFWALARGRPTATTEWVYLVRGDSLRKACVNLTSGTVDRWGDWA